MNHASEAQRLRTLFFYGAVLLVLVLGYKMVQPFLVQIGWAVVLAICLAPVQARLSQRFGSTPSAAFLTLLVLLLLIVPLLVVANLLAREGSHVVDYIHVHLADRGGPMGVFHIAWEWLHQRLGFLPEEQEVVQQLSDRVAGIASSAASSAGHIVKGAIGFLFGLVITLAILFFMLKDAPDMARALGNFLPFGRERNGRMLVLVHDIVSASVTSTLIIAIIQGVLGAVAFLLLGVPGALLWGFAMAVLALLPAVGAALVWVPAAVWLVLTGSIGKGVVLILVGVLVLGNTDNIVRPLMLSGTARMNTLVLIVSLMGGVSAFGFIGIVLGPVVAAVITALVETYAMAPDGATSADAEPEVAVTIPADAQPHEAAPPPPPPPPLT